MSSVYADLGCLYEDQIRKPSHLKHTLAASKRPSLRQNVRTINGRPQSSDVH